MHLSASRLSTDEMPASMRPTVYRSFFHSLQHNGYTCGSTVMRMVANILMDKGHPRGSLSHDAIAVMMGTNPRIGTTEIEMGRGLDIYGIPHERMEPVSGRDGAGRIEDLRTWLKAGNLAPLRCLVGGVKHWVLATMVDKYGFHVLDPAHPRPRILSAAEIEAMIAPRGYEFWKVASYAPCRRLGFNSLSQSGIDDDLMRQAVIDLLQRHGDLEQRMVRSDAIEDLVMSVMSTKRSFGLWDEDRLLAVHVGTRRYPWQVLSGAGIRIGPDTTESIHAAMNQAPGGLFQSTVIAVHPDVGCGGRRLMEAAPGFYGFACIHGVEKRDGSVADGLRGPDFELERGNIRYFIRRTPEWCGPAPDLSDRVDKVPEPSPGL